MKKIYLSVLMVCSLAWSAQAQFSEGGIPASLRESLSLDEAPLQEYPTPNFAAILEQQNLDEANGVSKPYMVSTFVNADVTLLNSGIWSYLEDGSKIWRLSLTIPGSKAIDFFYDQFYLPEGVQLYLTNANGKQLLGAYTARNNTESGLFTNQAVQGDVVHLEMDIAADVAVSSIKFHINRMGAFYRGVGDLTHAYATTGGGVIPAQPVNENPGTSTCHIDANCQIPGIPLDKYLIPKNATVRILITNPRGNGEGFCTGTLINNTGNNKSGTCQPLILTASHCDGGNNRVNDSFAQWRFKFNYQYDSCGQSNLHTPKNQVIVGASFKARSNLPSMPGNPGDESLHLVADFLLLQLNSAVPSTYGAYLAGWNRDPYIAGDENYYTSFIGFHHPNGDVKKKSGGDYVDASGRFNQSEVQSTHWNIPFIYGGTQPGSSGSGLFDVDGLLIGDLSGGGNSPCGGASNFGKNGLYSKISYGWENEYDQSHFPQYAGAQSRLKDWLDPANTGTLKLGATLSDCSDMPDVRIDELRDNLERSINVYPNPSSTGIIRVKVNFAQSTNLKVRVYNALGALQKEFNVSGAYSGDYSFDCSDLANGMYMMNFSVGTVAVGKKVILNR